jgi:hypothetical protein
MAVSAVERIKSEASGRDLESQTHALNLDTFRATGVLVIRSFISPVQANQLAEDWKTVAWDEHGVRKLDYNPVNSTVLPESLVDFTRSPVVVDLLEPLFGTPVGLFNRRVVAKDASYEGDVFLHQDSGYHKGTLDKVSLFVALTPVTETSGGLEFWLGTHRFGFLGDAGAIDGSILPPDWPRATPLMAPGDAVIMDSRLWHGSGPNTSGEPRVIADLHYQAGWDASSRELLWRDHWEAQESLVLSDSVSLLSRGRLTTIRELDARIKVLEGASNADESG